MSRHLADSLDLPGTWRAERYAAVILLIGPNEKKVEIVLPYGAFTVDEIRAKAHAAIAALEGGGK